ncbi:MAG: hypothetical protein EXQ88_02220 [Alphaproteobacteria bacterium]|nr:hypothetical protein [Alphaproteobacteria bacterium]
MAEFALAVLRWFHVISGVMWIGLLYYFNFVQMPSMPKIPDDQKPAISKVIAPAALFWFRMAAASTVLWGLALAGPRLLPALAIGLADGSKSNAMIGVGMWLGLIMAFNVWFVIWPNQQRALGLVDATPEVKKASARTAMLFSRTNAALSLPMLFAMVAGPHIY